MNENLLKALKSLISDIESMQPFKDNTLFGPFSDHQYDDEGEVIEWPNLAISLEEAKKAVAEHEGVKVIEHQLNIGKSEIVRHVAEQQGIPVVNIKAVDTSKEDIGKILFLPTEEK